MLGRNSAFFAIALCLGSEMAAGQSPGAKPAPASAAGSAQTTPKPREPSRAAVREAVMESSAGQKLNENTITIVSGSLNSTYLYLASDMSVVLDGNALRVLPVIGKGGVQNIMDLLHLRGVDLAITQTDILRSVQQTGELGIGVGDKIVYVTKLYDEEMHVLARSEIADYKGLNEKIVNFGQSGSSADLSARLIFKALGITVKSVNVAQADALVLLKSGKIDATVEISGKPVNLFSSIRAGDGLKLLPIPYIDALEADYLPAELTSAEYPGLLAAGQSIESVAVGAVLVTLNWPRNTDRYRRVAQFVNSMFDSFVEFQKAPRHPKWREVNLAALLPGWKRFPAAQNWIEGPAAGSAAQVATPSQGAAPVIAPATLPAAATTAAATPVPTPTLVRPSDTAAKNEELYRQYQEWIRAHKQ